MKCFILSNNNIYKPLFIIIFLMAFNGVRCNNGSEIIVKSVIPDRGIVDPHVIIVNDTLYCMFGHDKSWHTVDTWVMDRWELWATADLTEWIHILDISPASTYIGDKPNCWAGDLAEKDGKFYWYFSNKNIDTGVMVASSMNGLWSDALRKPLLPQGLAKTKSYDPEIIKEGNRYYIMWGAGTYYIAELGYDMVSLKTNPEMVVIEDDSPDFIIASPKS
jgi:arabinoxylan arabinofuranohydrolase